MTTLHQMFKNAMTSGVPAAPRGTPSGIRARGPLPTVKAPTGGNQGPPTISNYGQNRITSNFGRNPAIPPQGTGDRGAGAQAPAPQAPQAPAPQAPATQTQTPVAQGQAQARFPTPANRKPVQSYQLKRPGNQAPSVFHNGRGFGNDPDAARMYHEAVMSGEDQDTAFNRAYDFAMLNRQNQQAAGDIPRGSTVSVGRDRDAAMERARLTALHEGWRYEDAPGAPGTGSGPTATAAAPKPAAPGSNLTADQARRLMEHGESQPNLRSIERHQQSQRSPLTLASQGGPGVPDPATIIANTNRLNDLKNFDPTQGPELSLDNLKFYADRNPDFYKPDPIPGMGVSPWLYGAGLMGAGTYLGTRAAPPLLQKLSPIVDRVRGRAPETPSPMRNVDISGQTGARPASPGASPGQAAPRAQPQASTAPQPEAAPRAQPQATRATPPPTSTAARAANTADDAGGAFSRTWNYVTKSPMSQVAQDAGNLVERLPGGSGAMRLGRAAANSRVGQFGRSVGRNAGRILGPLDAGLVGWDVADMGTEAAANKYVDEMNNDWMGKGRLFSPASVATMGIGLTNQNSRVGREAGAANAQALQARNRLQGYSGGPILDPRDDTVDAFSSQRAGENMQGSGLVNRLMTRAQQAGETTHVGAQIRDNADLQRIENARAFNERAGGNVGWDGARRELRDERQRLEDRGWTGGLRDYWGGGETAQPGDPSYWETLKDYYINPFYKRSNEEVRPVDVGIYMRAINNGGMDKEAFGGVAKALDLGLDVARGVGNFARAPLGKAWGKATDIAGDAYTLGSNVVDSGMSGTRRLFSKAQEGLSSLGGRVGRTPRNVNTPDTPPPTSAPKAAAPAPDPVDTPLPDADVTGGPVPDGATGTPGWWERLSSGAGKRWGGVKQQAQNAMDWPGQTRLGQGVRNAWDWTAQSRGGQMARRSAGPVMATAGTAGTVGLMGAAKHQMDAADDYTENTIMPNRQIMQNQIDEHSAINDATQNMGGVIPPRQSGENIVYEPTQAQGQELTQRGFGTYADVPDPNNPQGPPIQRFYPADPAEIAPEAWAQAPVNAQMLYLQTLQNEPQKLSSFLETHGQSDIERWLTSQGIDANSPDAQAMIQQTIQSHMDSNNMLDMQDAQGAMLETFRSKGYAELLSGAGGGAGGGGTAADLWDMAQEFMSSDAGKLVLGLGIPALSLVAGASLMMSGNGGMLSSLLGSVLGIGGVAGLAYSLYQMFGSSLGGSGGGEAPAAQDPNVSQAPPIDGYGTSAGVATRPVTPETQMEGIGLNPLYYADPNIPNAPALNFENQPAQGGGQPPANPTNAPVGANEATAPTAAAPALNEVSPGVFSADSLPRSVANWAGKDKQMDEAEVAAMLEAFIYGTPAAPQAADLEALAQGMSPEQRQTVYTKLNDKLRWVPERMIGGPEGAQRVNQLAGYLGMSPIYK